MAKQILTRYQLLERNTYLTCNYHIFFLRGSFSQSSSIYYVDMAILKQMYMKLIAY